MWLSRDMKYVQQENAKSTLKIQKKFKKKKTKPLHTTLIGRSVSEERPNSAPSKVN